MLTLFSVENSCVEALFPVKIPRYFSALAFTKPHQATKEMKNERKTLYSTINPASITHEKKNSHISAIIIYCSLYYYRKRDRVMFPDFQIEFPAESLGKEGHQRPYVYSETQGDSIVVGGRRRRRVSSVFISKSFIKKHIRLSTPHRRCSYSGRIPIGTKGLSFFRTTKFTYFFFPFTNIGHGRISGDMPLSEGGKVSFGQGEPTAPSGLLKCTQNGL